MDFCCTSDSLISLVRLFGLLICKGDYPTDPSSASTLSLGTTKLMGLPLRSIYHSICHTQMEYVPHNVAMENERKSLYVVALYFEICDRIIPFDAMGIGNQLYPQ